LISEEFLIGANGILPEKIVQCENFQAASMYRGMTGSNLVSPISLPLENITCLSVHPARLLPRVRRGRLPLTEYLKDSLLGILVLDGRTLRALKPSDHIFHWDSPVELKFAQQRPFG
jgi:hypothetical protein